MKNTILFFFLLMAAAVSAQSNSFVTDRLRAAEYLRIGTNTSQKVTGFDRVITAPGAHDSLPTSRAVVDFLEANFTPIGYYTAGTGISISDDVITNTAPDQVVSISGVGITPSGTYPNFTLTAADQSATNELQNLSLSGQSLGISSGTGVTLPVVGVTAGAGIGVSSSSGNFTVSNTGDLSDTNEIQTLSIAGQDLSLSLGGGTVTIPGGSSLGAGFVNGGGSGTIPTNTTANMGANNLRFGGSGLDGVNDFIGFYQDGDNAYGSGFNDNGDGEYFVTSRFLSDGFLGVFNVSRYGMYTAAENQTTGDGASITMNATGPVVYTTNGLGATYAAEYPDILTNDRSIPDVGLTKTLISSENGALGTGFTDGGGTGTIPDGTVAEIGNNSLRFGYTSTFITDIADAVGTYSGAQNFELTGFNDGADGQYGHFFSGKLDDNEAKITYDAYGLKVEASADLFATINAMYVTGGEFTMSSAANMDISAVGRVLLTNALVNPVSYTNAAAPNNTIFYSTTDSKLSYKDPGGAVHGLY